MPNVNYIDMTPTPRNQKPSSLAGFAGGFAGKVAQRQEQKQEADALSEIYKQYENDDKNLDTMLKAVNTNPTISNITKVNTANQIMAMKKYNNEQQKEAAKIAKKDKEEADKKTKNAAIVADIETRKKLTPGSLFAYNDDPALALQVTKENKTNQADRPIEVEQLGRINQIENSPEFKDGSNAKKQELLRNGGVSKENIKSVMEPFLVENKPEEKRNEVIAAKQAEADVGFAKTQAENQKKLTQHQQVLDQAAELNRKGITGRPWDTAMQAIGLVQFTSDGYRVFSSLAKDAVKNANIKATIGSQISQMEFGFFRDATINPNFRKEANDAIIKKEGLALRYEKLYADITENIIAENEGKIPERLESKVNERFAEQSEKLSLEVKKEAARFNAIQHVPKGHTLMFDDKGNPLHVPNDQVAKATQMGASS